MSERAIVKRLIDHSCRHRLVPLGLRQKGRSRLWFDDREWSAITVEFQPGFGVGTYLNVGAAWLWYDHGTGSSTFDEGGRIWWRDDGASTTEPPLGATGWRQWAGFIREQQFAKDIEVLIDVAAQRVQQLRDQFPDPCTTARRLAERPTNRGEDPLWHAYHTGAAHALCGEPDVARQAFGRIAATADDFDWQKKVHRRATELSAVDSPADLRQSVIDAIHATRQRLDLPLWAPPTDWS
jgi:hypothetical protein